MFIKDLGIHPGAHIYLCPQTLPKFHPSFDEVITEILLQDIKGYILIVFNKDKLLWKYRLQKRLSLVSQNTDRIVFVPTVDSVKFRLLIEISQVLLDPFPFGGGVTTLEALANCRSVVTLPTAQTVPHLTAGMYLKMGITEFFVAENKEHYISIALDLGTRTDARKRAEGMICDKKKILYDQEHAVKEWENFLFTANKELQ